MPFSISVVADNQPPVISGSGTATILIGEAYSFTPTASDPESDPYGWSVLQRLGLAVPLGGTTVFFRRKALETLGVPPSAIVELPEGNAVETALRAARPGDLLVVCCSVLGLRDEWATITSFGRGGADQSED